VTPSRDRDVLALVPPTEEIVHLDLVWQLDADTSPLRMLELWRPTDAADEGVRRFLLDFGRRVLAAAPNFDAAQAEKFAAYVSSAERG
jgi:hypothetical protein